LARHPRNLFCPEIIEMDFNNVDAKTAFKMGFLARCSEEGLTGADLDARIKQAGALDGLGSLLSSGAFATVGLPLAGGLIAGGLGGYGAAKMTTPELDDDTLKSEELANTYKAYANRLRSRKKALQYRPAR
jgi:hypothetical protein